MKRPERYNKRTFRGAFCSSFNLITGEIEKWQRDTAARSRKCDGAKTRSWAGATPLFVLMVRKVTRGVAPAHRRW